MKPWKLLILVLLISPKAYAQNLDISLFDDEQPQLGRQAAPLQEIRLTPPPLPNITVGLGDNTPTPVITMPVTQEPVSPSVPINLPPPTTGENAQPSSEQPAQVIPPHDVHGYDLKGFYLGMPMNSVKNMLKSKGFTIKTIREDIPRFYTTDYEYKCRDEGVIIPEKVRACILNKARKENQAYVAEIDAEHGNERFEFLFTSNNVYNELYKITYYNYGDTSLNFTRVNTMKKLNRQKDFWNAVMDTYGKPDDAQKMIWGDPTKAYMTAKMFGTAYHGMIMFVDQQMYNRDYFFSEDAEAERPSKYHFNFSEG